LQGTSDQEDLMTQMTRQQMTEFDAAEFELIVRRDQAFSLLARLQQQAHHMAGDKRRGFGSTRWEMTDGQAEMAVHCTAEGTDSYVPQYGMRPSDLITQVVTARNAINELNASIEAAENEYRAYGGWQRYFPCLNTDGHIHATLRGCKTVYWDTSMGWATQYSGLTTDEAIHGIPGQFEGLGETLCSVCFPDAPVEWCRTRSEVTRTERMAAKAAKDAERDAVKAAKNLAETFRTWDGDRITTVAAAKALVRKLAETQVELEWNQTLEASRRWVNPDLYNEFIARAEVSLACDRKDAEALGLILADREVTAPGTGWSRADQDKALADALKRHRRAWFR
jgi:hypothetical protein